MQNRFYLWIITLLISVFFLSGCASDSLEVTDVWARPAAAGDNTAAYFTINNPSLSSDTLLNASADIARAVELHESMISNEGMGGQEQMEMVPQESVRVPFMRNVEFKPGGLHVMFIELQQDLAVGDTFELTLNFEKAGEVVLVVPVQMP